MAKRFFCIFCAAAVLLTALAYPAFANAAKPESILLFGDSISTGYGLSNVTQSFGKQLENTLGLTATGYRNFAVDGATSSQILTVVKSHTKEIAAADTVLLTAGGNDMLSIFLANVKTALGLSGGATATQVAVAILTKTDAISLVAVQLQKPAVQTKLLTAEATFSKNLSAIVTTVKAANPSAKLYIQTVYNPFNGINGMESLSKVADTILGAINQSIINGATTSGATASGSAARYTVIDTASAFKGKAQTLTNMAVFDIHPNVDGHRAIFNLAYTAITGKRYTPPAVSCALSNGRLAVKVSGLPAGAAQLNISAVNANDKKDTQKKAAGVTAGKATVTLSGKGTDYTVDITELNADKETFALGTVEVKDKAAVVGIRYAIRPQGTGWSAFAKDGAQAGATGNATSMQALKASLTGKPPAGAAVLYQTFLQGKGWQKAVSNGAASVPDGKSLPIKAIRFTLKNLSGYSVKYRAFTKGKGWLSWVQTKNGAPLAKAAVTGSTGQSLGIQTIEIELIKC